MHVAMTHHLGGHQVAKRVVSHSGGVVSALMIGVAMTDSSSECVEAKSSSSSKSLPLEVGDD